MYNIKNSKELASYINYTNLNNIISEEEMKEFLEKAKETTFHSVVVSPTYVQLAKEILADTDIKVGSVVGFPLGFEDTESKLAETKTLLDKGVDELEVVINLSYLKDKKYSLIGKEIEAIKELMGDKILKVNIEVKALDDAEKSAIHIYEIVNDINIIQKYAPKIKIEIYGGIDSYKLANQVLTAGADNISSNYGYEIVKQYKELRENTQVKPKPITL